AVFGELVRQPHDAAGRMVEHGGGDSGVLDRLVAVEQRIHPAQVDGVDGDRATAEDHRAQGRVVRDGVDDRAPVHLDARGQDLERGNHVLGGPQDVEEADIGSAQLLTQDEGELDLDAHSRV